MIRIKNIEISTRMGGGFDGTVELIFTDPREAEVMRELSMANEDLSVYMKHAADDISGRNKGGRSWQLGNKLECLTAEGAFSLNRGMVYTFDGFNRGGRVKLQEFPTTTFDASRFRAVPGLIQYGEPLKGKTSIGVNSLSGPVSNQVLTGLAGALGLKMDSGKKTVTEDKTTGHIYIHGKANKPKGIPPRRARQGRKLIP